MYKFAYLVCLSWLENVNRQEKSPYSSYFKEDCQGKLTRRENPLSPLKKSCPLENEASLGGVCAEQHGFLYVTKLVLNVALDLCVVFVIFFNEFWNLSRRMKE